jgi:glycosyltransferase involved in cell wall biosynthesis
LGQQAPTVTVVIPTFNRPALLLRAVESVLRQTFGHFEIVVVIDGLDPASRDVIEQLREPRLRYLELPEKVGGSEARNVGVRSANGRWIALLDDDDEWLPDKLEMQLASAESSQNDGMLVTSRYICRATGFADVVRPRRLPKTVNLFLSSCSTIYVIFRRQHSCVQERFFCAYSSTTAFVFFRI